MNTTENTVKKPSKAEKPVKRNKRFTLYVTLFLAAAALGFIIAVVKFFGTEKAKRNASITIEFTYEGAAQNLTPSGEQFSINGVFNDEIISAALQSAELSNKYKVDDIKNSLTVSGQYPGDVIDQIKDYDSLYDFNESRRITLDNYYPTIYQLKLNDDFDPGASDTTMRKIVKSIAEVYRNYFINRYRYTYDIEKFDNMLVLDNYDFSQRVKILRYRMDMLEKYASEIYALNTNYRFNGLSFNDLLLKCRALENDSLDNAEATVMTDVLSVSATRLKNQYQYEIKLLENEKAYKTTELEDLSALIDLYQTDGTLYIPSGDSVVKLDSNSKDTYESLMSKKKEISTRLVNIESDIDRYNGYLEDLNSTTYVSSTKTTVVSEKLASIDEKLKDLESALRIMLAGYNSTIVDESSVLLDSAVSTGAKLFSGSFILTLIKCAGPFCVIVLIICFLHAALFEIKRYRKNQAEV